MPQLVSNRRVRVHFSVEQLSRSYRVWKEDVPKQEGACVALFYTRHTGAPGCFQIEAAGDVGLLEKLGIGVGFSRDSIRQVNMQIEAERESARRLSR
jgi:hypothetical protein